MTPTQPQRSAWTRAAWIVGVLLVLYPLSVGPVSWLQSRHYISQTTFLRLYQPLGPVLAHRKVQEWYFWYVSLFVDLQVPRR